jgi:ubiquinone/menaquinone biosynthesis C-methylase UbiE
MEAPSSSGAEAARIRDVYLRRDSTIPKDRYSLFKEENLLTHLDVQRGILRLFRQFHLTNLQENKVLDVGCGRGYWLRQLMQWGARPENLFGIDLMQDRVADGKKLCPDSVKLQCGDASHLLFEDGTFDLVLQFTVFTSILDTAMKKRVAAEIGRVLKPSGLVLWYDYFVSNPSNPDVRGVSRKEICDLFPTFSINLQRITLAPPLARTVGPISPALYHFLSMFSPLRTHYLGFLQKP